MTHQPAGLHDHVATLLDAMGTDPVAIATTLRAEHIHGIRGSVLVHPVCRWLIRLVPDLGAVLGRDTVNVFRPGRGRGIHGAVVPLPDAVRAFADRFDEGEHPELELSMMPPLIASSALTAGREGPGEYEETAEYAEATAYEETAEYAETASYAGAGTPQSADADRPVSPASAGAAAGAPAAEAPAAEAPEAPAPAAPAEPAEPRVPAQAAGAADPAGSRKAKRRKPKREPAEAAVSGRRAGAASPDPTSDTSREATEDGAGDASSSDRSGAGAPSGGARAPESPRAPEPVAPRRPTGTARTATGPIPPRNLMTDTVRLVAVRG